MGRHSAVGDDEEVEVAVVAAPEPPAAGSGRHARGEDLEDTGPVPGAAVRVLEHRAAAQDEQPTQRISLDEPLTAAPAEAGPAPEQTFPVEPGRVEAAPEAQAAPATPKPTSRGSHSTAADLALLRRHADVRNRVLGAVVVPFVLYVAVLLILGAPAVHYLLWIWTPTVTAGVLAGLILDAAHRHRPLTEERGDDPHSTSKPSASAP